MIGEKAAAHAVAFFFCAPLSIEFLGLPAPLTGVGFKWNGTQTNPWGKRLDLGHRRRGIRRRNRFVRSGLRTEARVSRIARRAQQIRRQATDPCGWRRADAELR